MATKYIFLVGTGKWAKVYPHNKDMQYNRYTLQLYLDKSEMKKFKDSGLRLEVHTDEDGEFIRPRRDVAKLFENMPEAPKVVIWNPDTKAYEPFSELIGNGSLLNCKIAVYDSAKGKGHRLEAVAVEKLVEYSGAQQDDMPF